MIRLSFAILLAFGAGVLNAQARVPLSEDKRLEDGLTLVAIGAKLSRTCNDISPRYVKSYNFARGLYNRAEALGYSDAEIDAYLDSEPDKARVEARARAYLEARGGDYEQPSTLCKVARSEIANGTSVGTFLRVN